MAKDFSKIIPIAMICDDAFVMPTCVAITSMLENKNEDTFYDIFIIMAECSEESERYINAFENEGCKLNIIRVDLSKYADIKQLAHVSKACLLKFDISDLIPQYDKILYLDGDIIVRGDLYDFYSTELGDSYAAGVLDMENIESYSGNINAGILVYNAKKIRDEKLRDIMVETRKSLGDRGSMDQQTFNIVTNKNYVYVPIKYNCIPGKILRDDTYPINKLNELYKTEYANAHELVDDACIIHYATSNKPWKYTFNEEAKEWYAYYLKSPYKDVPFKLRGRWEYRKDELLKVIKEKGIRGIFDKLKERKERKQKTNVKWE